MDAVWSAVLGEDDMRALEHLYAKLIWIPDGETAALGDAARAYREIIGQPDPAAPESSLGQPGADSGEDGGDPNGHRGDGEGDGPSIGSLTEAVEHALEQTRAGQVEQLHEEIDLQELLDQVAHGDPGAPARGREHGTGTPTGRMPARGGSPASSAHRSRRHTWR